MTTTLPGSSERFFDFFPPPRFLSLPAAGLAFSDTSIRFALLRRSKGHYELEEYGERALPTGAIVDGAIKDSSAVQKVLSHLQEDREIQLVHVSLPEQQSYLVEIPLLYVRPSETRGSIELQLAEYVPLSPENVVFDYTLIPSRGEEDKKHQSAGVAVMRKEIIAQYVNLFAGTGLVPLSFELEAHAITRAIVESGDEHTYMLVDIGEQRTGIAIVSKGVVRFTTTITIGGARFTHAIARELNISHDEAVLKKEEHGFTPRDGNTSDVSSALLAPASSLRDEIVRYYEYWLGEKRSDHKIEERKIERVFVSGTEAGIPGLPQYLAGKMPVPVSEADPWINIASRDEYIPELSRKNALGYVTALGLSLRSFQ